MVAPAVKQLKAFDVEPVRKKVIVRPGHAAWWGVDPSTKRIAIGVVFADGLRTGRVQSIAQLEGAQRLEAIRCATVALCDELGAGPSMPGVIVVEAPAGFGKRPNPELAYAVGAVLCGLAGALPGVRVDFVASARWKLQVCGSGAIAKPKPTSGEPYAVLEWAHDAGYVGKSWDEADAWAIAEYARLTYELDPR